MAYAMSRGKKQIWRHVNGLFVNKKRENLFDVDVSGSGSRHILALIFASSLITAIFIYYYYEIQDGRMSSGESTPLLLLCYAGAVLAYFFLKSILYYITNWVFFKKEQQKKWSDIYSDLLGVSSFILFPLVLVLVYSSSYYTIIEYTFLIFFVFAKILLFYNCVKNFFNRIQGLFHLILYFCTLEIIPLFLMWNGVEFINRLITLKN